MGLSGDFLTRGSRMVARVALRLLRARGAVPNAGPLQTYNQLTAWLSDFWLHQAVTLPRPNTIVNCSVNQSELLNIFPLPLIAGPQKLLARVPHSPLAPSPL